MQFFPLSLLFLYDSNVILLHQIHVLSSLFGIYHMILAAVELDSPRFFPLFLFGIHHDSSMILLHQILVPSSVPLSLWNSP